MAPPPHPLWRVESHGRERHPPGERWWYDNRTRHGDLCVVQLAISGRMRLVAGGDLDVGPGQAALFLHPSETHYGLPPEASETFVTEWVVLRGAGLAEHWAGIAALRGGPVVPMAIDGPLHRALRSLCVLADPRRHTAAPTMAAAVHGFVMQMWEGAAEARTSALRPVEQAIEGMLAAPTAPWSLKRLADERGISREHLARAFRERVGVPPAAWLAEQRVRRAIELLEHTDLPIRAVRDQAGFASSHTLIRRVRAVTGRSPLAVRRRSRG